MQSLFGRRDEWAVLHALHCMELTLILILFLIDHPLHPGPDPGPDLDPATAPQPQPLPQLL